MSEFRNLPAPVSSDPAQLRRDLDDAIKRINGLGSGKSGNVIEVTLTASQATTTVASPLIGYQSAFLWDPLTANAAAELVANGPPLAMTANRMIGSATFTHVDNSQTDRTFRVAVIG